MQITVLYIHKGLVHPFFGCASHVWWLHSFSPSGQSGLKGFLSLRVFSNCLLHLKFQHTGASLSSVTIIFMLTAHQNLLTACLPPSCNHITLNILIMFIPFLSKFLIKENHNFFSIRLFSSLI